MPRAFNPQAVLSNLVYVKDLIRRIRQKEGGVGSDADELVLSRLVFDMDFLIELAEVLGTNNQKLMQLVQERAHESKSNGQEREGDGRDQNIQLDQTPS